MVFKRSIFKKILSVLRPEVYIPGLEISDGSIFFVSFKDSGEIVQKSIKIPEGIIYDGVVINKGEFEKILEKFHKEISSSDKDIPVIVSISDNNVYTQVFSIPALTDDNLESAIKLNLQIISPLDFSQSYHGWQFISAKPSDIGEIEVLSSFILKDVINSLTDSLIRSKFIPVAIEQKAFSLSRLVLSACKNFSEENQCLILSVNGDGISFSFIKNKKLYFNHFSSWSSLFKNRSDSRQVPFEEFEKIITRETSKIVNFYGSHFSGNLSGIYIFAPSLENQIKEIIKKNFSLKIEDINLDGYKLDHSWANCLGAAIRGTFPRSKDQEISLMSEGTQELFLESQIISFSSLWRKIIISVLTIILISFSGVFVFLQYFTNNFMKSIQENSLKYDSVTLSSLRKEAGEFNEAVARAIKVKSGRVNLNSNLKNIFNNLNNKDIIVDRLYMQSSATPIILNARAKGENEIVEFKNRLESSNQISNINLPISSFVQTLEPVYKMDFQMTFFFKDLNL